MSAMVICGWGGMSGGHGLSLVAGSSWWTAPSRAGADCARRRRRRRSSDGTAVGPELGRAGRRA